MPAYRGASRWKRCVGEACERCAELLCLLQSTNLPAPAQVCHPGSSLNPTVGDFYGAPAYRRDESLNPFSDLLSSPQMEGRAENFKLLIMAWPFIQEPTKSHFIRTKDTLTTQKIPRDLCQELKSKTKHWNKRCSGALITQEITGVVGALCQEPGAKIHIFCYLTYAYTTFCLSAHPSMDIWVAFTF